MHNTIVIRNGTTFDFDCPHNSSFAMKDIAHALSNLCRFNGHTKHFYSVAQHSVLMSYAVPQEYALVGLLYKSAQAFTGCLPVELSRIIPGHQELESSVQAAIFLRFGLPEKVPDCVYSTMLALEATEWRDILPDCPEKAVELIDVKPLSNGISPWFPTESARYFLTRYKELTTLRVAESAPEKPVSMY